MLTGDGQCTAARRSFSRTRTGVTSSCFTNTSTVTTALAWVPAIRRAGPLWSPSSYSKAVNSPGVGERERAQSTVSDRLWLHSEKRVDMTPQPPSIAKPFAWRRLIPVLVFVAGLGVFFALGLERYLAIDALRQHRGVLRAWVETSGVLAALVFMAVYIITVAFSLPGATVLTIASGFLFGPVWGTVIVVISATLGGTALFSMAKTTLGDALRARAGSWLPRLEAGFKEHALSYLIVLRLVPIFPFFVINLVPAFLGVSLWTFVLGTFVGIIPGSFVYTTVGAGLGSVFDAGGTFSLRGVLTPQIVTALVGLAVLAMVPIVYKKIMAHRGERPGTPRPHVS